MAGLTHRQRYQLAVERQRAQRLVADGKIVPERITAALDLQGLDGPEVDHACGVQEPTVDLWEAGESTPTAEQMEALARLTGFPVAFFYRPMPPLRGVVWLCGAGGCEATHVGPDAEVIPLSGRGRLF